MTNELYHYREFLTGKSILCNADDPFESYFFKYFAAKFNGLELKKLTATSFADSPIAGEELTLFPDNKTAYKVEVTELKDWNGDGRESLDDVQYAIEHGFYNVTELKGDAKYCAGDFRSQEVENLNFLHSFCNTSIVNLQCSKKKSPTKRRFFEI